MARTMFALPELHDGHRQHFAQEYLLFRLHDVLECIRLRRHKNVVAHRTSVSSIERSIGPAARVSLLLPTLYEKSLVAGSRF